MSTTVDAGWRTYALTGRPDFLNYLRRGDVTWRELWDYYREQPTDADTCVRLCNLFHIFLSHDYDREGAVLDREGSVYANLYEWAEFAVECQEFLPEEKVRDGLAGVLAEGLIAPLYYEAVFSVYLEASLERHARVWSAGAAPLNGDLEVPRPRTLQRRLTFRLPDLPGPSGVSRTPAWDETLSVLAGRHYEGWNYAYTVALGADEDGYMDEGGEG